MKAVVQLKKHLKRGHVYRREDLIPWSRAVDRHLKQLVLDGTLQKMSQGVYYRPAKTSWGEVPPNDRELVRAFLKTDDFLLMSPNFYNALGVGLTQLYNKKVVYNHKRHGKFVLADKEFDFCLKHKFPQNLTEEFLFVDLLNNLDDLLEDRQVILQNVQKKIFDMGPDAFKRAVNAYAGERTKKLFNAWLKQENINGS